jgi:hypothetical protein
MTIKNPRVTAGERSIPYVDDASLSTPTQFRPLIQYW